MMFCLLNDVLQSCSDWLRSAIFDRMCATVNCFVCYPKSFSANIEITRFRHNSDDMCMY